jgi:polysaccharide biosynthesis protein PslH
MRILFLHKQMLFPHDTGGKIRALNVLRHLPRWHEVTYVCNIRRGEERYVPQMQALGLHLEAVPGEASRRGGLRFAAGLARNLLSSRPFSVNRNFDPLVRQKVAELLKRQQFDVLICDCVQMARHVFGQRARVNVLFQHNVEAQILQRHAAASSTWMRRRYMKRDWKKMQRFEAECGRHFEGVIAVSAADKKTFENDYGWSHVDVIETAVDTDFFRENTEAPEADRVLFVGSMDWLPNQDGVRWFVNEIWPRVRAQRPGALFQVVGRNPPAEIQALGRAAGVEIVGGVPDVRPYLREASVCIVPLLVGGGTRLKIFEAMSTGRAVVSTGIGAEGLPIQAGEHYLSADDPAEFAAAVLRVLENPELGRKLARTACQFVRERFGTEPIARQFEAICLRLWQEHTSAAAVVHAQL